MCVRGRPGAVSRWRYGVRIRSPNVRPRDERLAYVSFMAVGDAAHLLRLVTTAVDGFEEAPVPASVRRALRIAKLRGDADATARLGLDTMHHVHKGLAEANPAVLKSFMDNREHWRDSPRHWVGRRGPLPDRGPLTNFGEPVADPPMELSTHTKIRRTNLDQVRAHIADRVRSYTFLYLVGCETQLRFANAAEDIFTEHRLATERHLADVARRARPTQRGDRPGGARVEKRGRMH